MHRKRGHARSPLSVSGIRRTSAPTARQQRGRGTPRSPAIPVAVRVGERTSPRLTAAASRQGLVRGSNHCDKGEDHVGESQPLLSPAPAAGVVAPARPPGYVCDWAQAITCTFTELAPLPCQQQGCDILVHHICQGAWENREGYDNVVAQYCYRHCNIMVEAENHPTLHLTSISCIYKVI